MRLGLFGGAQSDPADPARGYHDYLDFLLEAEALGYHGCFLTEHHFTGWGQVSAPLHMLSWLAARTTTLRLGTAVMVLAWHNPMLLAEQVATVDVLSGGRLDLGIGRGYRHNEFHGFAMDAGEAEARFAESLDVMTRAWTSRDRFSHHGEFWNFDDVVLEPPPLQAPHPPLWVACSQLETIEMAGRCGIGALGFQFLSADMANAWVHAYYNSFVLRQNKLADYQSNCNIAMVSYFMCAETDEEARRRADGVTFFQFSLAYYSNSRNRERAAPGTVSLWEEYLKWKIANPELADKALTGGLIGSPETIRKKLRRFETSHVDQIILLNQAGKNSHPHICESLEMFASEVMPEFTAKEPEHQEWKRKVLSREIELEDIDTSPYKTRAGVGKGVAIDKLATAAE